MRHAAEICRISARRGLKLAVGTRGRATLRRAVSVAEVVGRAVYAASVSVCCALVDLVPPHAARRSRRAGVASVAVVGARARAAPPHRVSTRDVVAEGAHEPVVAAAALACAVLVGSRALDLAARVADGVRTGRARRALVRVDAACAAWILTVVARGAIVLSVDVDADSLRGVGARLLLALPGAAQLARVAHERVLAALARPRAICACATRAAAARRARAVREAGARRDLVEALVARRAVAAARRAARVLEGGGGA